MRLKEKLFDKTPLNELEKTCVWLGGAFLEHYQNQEMRRANEFRGLRYVAKLNYSKTGCYNCDGHEEQCSFYDSEKTLITKKLDKERHKLHMFF